MGHDPGLVRARNLSAIPWLRHGFGTRVSGLSHPSTEPRRHPKLLMLRQVHSAMVWVDPEPGQAGDGMITQHSGRLLTIRTADCCPILLVDTRQRVVAAVHAGWRGTVARIAAIAVGEMQSQLGTLPQDIRAALGPCIGSCCYEVGEDVRSAFAARFSNSERWFFAAEPDPVRSRYPMLFMTGAPPGHPYDPRWNHTPAHRLDLHAALRQQLVESGVSDAAVETISACTACERARWYSHRRGDTGRLLSAIGVVQKFA